MDEINPMNGLPLIGDHDINGNLYGCNGNDYMRGFTMASGFSNNILDLTPHLLKFIKDNDEENLNEQSK